MRGAVDGAGRVASWKEELWGNRHITRPGRHPNPGLLASWHLEQGFDPPPAVDFPLAMGGGSQRNAVPYYEFPDELVLNHIVTAEPVRVSVLRALAAYLNVFAIECFMDELAAAAGADPVDFRLRHLTDARARGRSSRGRQGRLEAGREGGWHARYGPRFRPLQEYRRLRCGRGRGDR